MATIKVLRDIPWTKQVAGVFRDSKSKSYTNQLEDLFAKLINNKEFRSIYRRKDDHNLIKEDMEKFNMIFMNTIYDRLGELNPDRIELSNP